MTASPAVPRLFRFRSHPPAPESEPPADAAPATVLVAFLLLRFLYMLLYFLFEKEGFHFFRFDDIVRSGTAYAWSLHPFWGFDRHLLPFPFWLNGLLLRFVGDHLTVPILGNLVCSSLSLVGLYALSRRLAPAEPWAALIPVAILAEKNLFNALSLSGGVEAFFQCCVVWAIFFLHRHWDTPRQRDLAAALLLFTAASLTRYEAQAWAFVVGGAILWRHRRDGVEARLVAAVAAAALVVPPLIPAPNRVGNAFASPASQVTQWLAYYLRVSPLTLAAGAFVLFKRNDAAAKRHAVLILVFAAMLLAIVCWQIFATFHRVALTIVVLATPLLAVAAADAAQRLGRHGKNVLLTTTILLPFAFWKTCRQEHRPVTCETGLVQAGRVFAHTRRYFPADVLPRVWTETYIPPPGNVTFPYEYAYLIPHYAMPEALLDPNSAAVAVPPLRTYRARLTSFLNVHGVDLAVVSRPETIAAMPADFIPLGRVGRYAIFHRERRRTTVYFQQMFRSSGNRPADALCDDYYRALRTIFSS